MSPRRKRQFWLKETRFPGREFPKAMQLRRTSRQKPIPAFRFRFMMCLNRDTTDRRRMESVRRGSHRLCSQLERNVGSVVLVRVISWIVALFLAQTDDPRNHTNRHETKSALT